MKQTNNHNHYSGFSQAFSMAPREAPTPTQLTGMPHNCSIALM